MGASTERKHWKALRAVLLLAIAVLCLIAHALGNVNVASNVLSVVEVLSVRPDTQWLFVIYFLVWAICFIRIFEVHSG